jgi:hypothetical protein
MMGAYPLSTIYEPFIRNLRTFVSNEVERFQILFRRYARFLVALCKECKPRRIGYSVRLRLGTGESVIAELQAWKKPVIRAA